MKDVPTLVLILVLWSYWLGVFFMIFYAAKGNFRAAGLIPKHRLEGLLWLFWIPIIIAWNAVPFFVFTKGRFPFAVPNATELFIFRAVRWIAAILCVVCLLGTILCWKRLGKDWSIAVVPRRTPRLVTDGLYARIRHPIYALTMLLMLCSVVIVPNVIMIFLAIVHFILTHLKARNEERFLLQVYGQEYVGYCRRTGRFFPQLVARAPILGSEPDGQP